VSRAKFAREIAQYFKLEDEHIRRGWLLVKHEWPEVFVVFGVPQLRPPAILFGALIDFTDYDFYPPSVTLVHPFTRVPYKMNEVPSSLQRTVPAQVPPQILAMMGVAPNLQMQQQQPLLVAFTPDEIPFLCVAGTYEYHNNPGHTADSWFAHRGTENEGTLYYLLNILYQYGTAPITEYAVQPVVKGFLQGEAPK
jgi:hypothetical protein